MKLKQIFLILFLPMFAFGQNSLKINEEGQLSNRAYKKLAKKNGYDLISKFDTVSYTPSLIYALTFKNDRLGLIDIEGKEILANEYDDIVGLGRTNSIVSEYHDYILLKKDNRWAVATIDGRLITEFKYEWLKVEKSRQVDARKNKPEARWKIPIKKDSIFKASYDCNDYGCKHLYIDTKGQQIQHFGQEEQDRYWEKHGHYPKSANRPKKKDHNFNIPKALGKATVYKDHLFKITAKKNNAYHKGIYDTLAKKLILPVEYTGIRRAGQLPYFFASKSGDSFILDSLGNRMTEIPLKNAYEIGASDNVAIIARDQNNKLAILSKSCQALTEFKYDNISYSNTLILGRVAKQYQLMDYNGKEIKFEEAYDRIRFKTNKGGGYLESFVYLEKDKKFAIVSETGKLESGFDYDRIIPECFVSSGKYTLSEEFNMVANHPNRYIFFKKDGKYGIMDNDYNVILKNDYDMVLESRVVGFVYIGKKVENESAYKMLWGVFDVLNKKEIIPTQFDARINNTSTFFLVKENNKYGLIDKYGKEIFPRVNEQEISATYIYKGLFSFEKKYKVPFAFMDSTGKIVTLKEKE